MSQTTDYHGWQATKSNLKERFKFIFGKTILSDIRFLVGKDDQRQSIPAHKFVLSVGSAVFDAMFNGDLAVQESEVVLDDVDPKGFLALLSFLYMDDHQVDAESVMATLYCAKKYAVPALENACVDFLKSNLQSDNAFLLLTQARLFDELQLAQLCLETIDKNTAEALSAEGFCDIDHDTLCLVLERDSLRVKETELFSALCRWAKAECSRQGLQGTPENQRSVMGRALRLIRFPLMTSEEFALAPAQSQILTSDESVSMFLYYHKVNPKPKVDFIDVPRCCMVGREQTMCRFQHPESRWGYSGTTDKFRFQVNRRIFVLGFGLYGSVHGPAEYDVTIQIHMTSSGEALASHDTTFSSDGSSSTFRVLFKDPVEITPNLSYTACATLKGPDSYYGTRGQGRVTLDCLNGTKVTFLMTSALGNNNGTTVEDGQIPEIIFYT